MRRTTGRVTPLARCSGLRNVRIGARAMKNNLSVWRLSTLACLSWAVGCGGASTSLGPTPGGGSEPDSSVIDDDGGADVSSTDEANPIVPDATSDGLDAGGAGETSGDERGAGRADADAAREADAAGTDGRTDS